MNELTLDYFANLYNSDKGTQHFMHHNNGVSRHGYAPIYENYLNKWRNDPIRMLEIGVCMEFTHGGHSIKMWADYFTQAYIYTFDIVDMSNHEAIKNSHRVKFFQGDQSKRDDLQKMYESFGNEPFSFILEDGSHEHKHQVISLGALFKYVVPGGYYILEDMSVKDRPVCCIRNDETYKMINEFKNTGKIVSEYLTEEEIRYLESNIKSIDLFDDIQNAYAVAIIQKK